MNIDEYVKYDGHIMSHLVCCWQGPWPWKYLISTICPPHKHWHLDLQTYQYSKSTGWLLTLVGNIGQHLRHPVISPQRMSTHRTSLAIDRFENLNNAINRAMDKHYFNPKSADERNHRWIRSFILQHTGWIQHKNIILGYAHARNSMSQCCRMD